MLPRMIASRLNDLTMRMPCTVSWMVPMMRADPSNCRRACLRTRRISRPSRSAPTGISASSMAAISGSR